MKTQEERILTWLKSGLILTPMIALSKFGCMRLAARVHNLRKNGHEINTLKLRRNGKNFAGYVL